jgi:carbamoyltransferase
VFEKWNPDYYRLIRNVKELSGIGVILNTSFNLHGFPIVCKPSEAINVFNNSGLKHLAIGDYLVSKES